MRAFRCTREVQFFCDSDKVPHMTKFHGPIGDFIHQS
jgi:hypothetical protein